MSGVGRFIRKRRAKRAAFMADPAILLAAIDRVRNKEREVNGNELGIVAP